MLMSIKINTRVFVFFNTKLTAVESASIITGTINSSSVYVYSKLFLTSCGFK